MEVVGLFVVGLFVAGVYEVLLNLVVPYEVRLNVVGLFSSELFPRWQLLLSGIHRTVICQMLRMIDFRSGKKWPNKKKLTIHICPKFFMIALAGSKSRIFWFLSVCLLYLTTAAA